MIFVSHRLDEVFELCDRVSVFRDGRSRRDSRHPEDRPQGLDPGDARRAGGSEDGYRAPARRLYFRSAGSDDHGASLRPGQRRGGNAHTRERNHHRSGLPSRVGDEHDPVRAHGLVPEATGAIEVQGRALSLNTPRRAIAVLPERSAARGSLPRAVGCPQLDSYETAAAESRSGVPRLRRRVRRTARWCSRRWRERPSNGSGRRRGVSAAEINRRSCSGVHSGTKEPLCSHSTSPRAVSTSAGAPRFTGWCARGSEPGHSRHLLVDRARRGARPRGRRRHPLRRKDRLDRSARGGVGLHDPRAHDDERDGRRNRDVSTPLTSPFGRLRLDRSIRVFDVALAA